MKWIKAFDREILQHDDFVKGFTLDGKRLVAVKDGDKLIVTQPSCPHAGADLSRGWCKNGKLVCPYHRYEYDLQTGRGAAGQGDYIDIYPSEVRSDGIYVAVPNRLNFFQKLFRL